jgi:hypothetical protein
MADHSRSSCAAGSADIGRGDMRPTCGFWRCSRFASAILSVERVACPNYLSLSGSVVVFEEPSGADCIPGGVCPCGLEAGAPLLACVSWACPALRLFLTFRFGSERAASTRLRFIGGHVVLGIH